MAGRWKIFIVVGLGPAVALHKIVQCNVALYQYLMPWPYDICPMFNIHQLLYNNTITANIRCLVSMIHCLSD